MGSTRLLRSRRQLSNHFELRIQAHVSERDDLVDLTEHRRTNQHNRRDDIRTSKRINILDTRIAEPADASTNPCISDPRQAKGRLGNTSDRNTSFVQPGDKDLRIVIELT